VLNRNDALIALCGGKATDYEPLDISISQVGPLGLGIECDKVAETDTGYKTVEMQEGVYKLELAGGVCVVCAKLSEQLLSRSIYARLRSNMRALVQ
jgi:hypothetical protein